MDAAWTSNFTSGLAAGLLAPLLVWVLSKLFVRWTARSGLPTNPSTGQTSSDHSINTGTVYGPNNASIHDNRRYETTVVHQFLEQESSSRPNTGNSESDGSRIIVTALIAMTIGLLYVLFAPAFAAAALGTCISVVILATVVSRKTKKLLVDWPEGANQTLASVALAIGGTIFVGLILLTSQQGNLSLAALQQAASAGVAAKELETDESGNFVSVVLGALLAAGRSITLTFGIDGWYFFIRQTGAVILIFEILFIVLYRLLEWNTFLRFTTRTTRNRKALRRALAFPEKKWATLWASAGGIGLAAFLGSQWLFNSLQVS